MARLVLAHDLQIRELEAASFLCFKVPSAAEFVKATKDAGKCYSDRCRGRAPAVHGMGPPLPYLVEAAIRSMMTMEAIVGAPSEAELQEIHGMISEKSYLIEQFKHFKIKEMYDKRSVRLTMAITIPEVAAKVTRALLALGAEELQGTAPPGGLHRTLQEWLGQR